jgi:hypothetical protein
MSEPLIGIFYQRFYHYVLVPVSSLWQLIKLSWRLYTIIQGDWSHSIHNRMFTDCWNSMRFDWISKYIIAVSVQQPTQVKSCCNLLTPVRQLSSNGRSAKTPFSQAQRLFTAEHRLASRSDLITWQTGFRGTVPNSPVPNKSTVSGLVNRFRSLQSSSACCIRLVGIAGGPVHFRHLM